MSIIIPLILLWHFMIYIVWVLITFKIAQLVPQCQPSHHLLQSHGEDIYNPKMQSRAHNRE